MSNLGLDLQGIVNNLSLSTANSLWPLFETIVNAIQSIEDSENKASGKIEVVIERDHSQLTLDSNYDYAPFKSFTVIDNGEGFNSENYRSFLKAHSVKKVAKGCKGIGRFLWLKAFDYASIESSYYEKESWQIRHFKFSIQGGIQPEENIEKIDLGSFKTAVKLHGYHKSYQDKTIISLEGLAEEIIAHCLPYFLSENCPDIIVHDVDRKINLKAHFSNEIKGSLSEVTFELEDETFNLYHFKQPKGKHELHLCANSREVKSESLKEKIPNLSKKITADDGQSYFYNGYLMSSFLDRNVSSNRTKFDFEENEGLLETDIMNHILEQATIYIGHYLQDDLSKVKQHKKSRIDEFIKNVRPQYRFLLKEKPEIYDLIPPGLSDEKLEYELHMQEQLWELQIHKQGIKIEEKIRNKDIDQDFLKEAFNAHLNSIHEINKSSLAEYIIRRRTIIELLEKTLEISEEGKYSREDAIHSIICPMRYTSDDIPYEEMNLWLIDDRLSYHKYLSSDKSFRSLPLVDSDSLERMDLAIFDAPISFSEDQTHYNSISVIELKRTMRNDFGVDNDPIEQVLDYVETLRSGKAKNYVGRPIRGTETTAFYCYIITDLTPSIIKRAKLVGLTETADHQGYFGYFKNYNAYLQIMTYDKLLNDAKKRNQILFDKLFHPKVKIGEHER